MAITREGALQLRYTTITRSGVCVDYEDEEAEECKVAWKPKVRPRFKEDLHVTLQAAPATDAVMNSQGNIHLRTRQYNHTITGGSLDNEVITAFCCFLERGDTKRSRKILAAAFYEALTNTNRTRADREHGKVPMQEAARYTQ